MIIAIDGPAGSGKSSTARAVAARLGFHHLDSGAFYRALTFAALEAEVPPEEWGSLSPARLDAFGLGARPDGSGFRITLRGRDVMDRLRSPEIDARVSDMARAPAVRDWLLEWLRDLAEGLDVVADGRDIGTVVFPDAELKVFLLATERTRARRRLAEQGRGHPSPAEIEEAAERLRNRDRMDSTRPIAPLRKAPEAIEIDTTRLDFTRQVELVASLVRERLGKRSTAGGDIRPRA